MPLLLSPDPAPFLISVTEQEQVVIAKEEASFGV
jgi:hypothetical protein